MPQFHVSAWASVVLVVSIGLAVGWLLLLWLVSMPGRERHLRAQAATSDLGPEPPAVAALLGRGGRVGDGVAAATLLDLAARHIIDLEQTGPGLTLCRVRPADGRSPGGAPADGPPVDGSGPAGVTPYVRRILSYLDALAIDGVVPAPALAEGVTRSAAWWKKLRGEVIADTWARRLSRPRWSPGAGDGPAWSDGLTPGLNLATLVPAADAAILLGAPVNAAQALGASGPASC
jgi:hypothetical protein